MSKQVLDNIIRACSVKFDSLVELVGEDQAYCFRAVQCEYSMRFSEKFLLDCVKISEGTPLKNFYERHYEEEKGHHSWALSDLEQLRSHFLYQWPVSKSLRALIGQQEAAIRANDCYSQIGYAISVECYQGEPEYWSSLIGRTNLPTTAFKNVVNHSTIDIGHSKDLLELESSLPEEARSIVWKSAYSSGHAQVGSVEEAIRFACS